MEIIINHLVWSFPATTKRDFSDSLWTQFGLCRKGVKLAEYATTNEVIMKQVIWDCFRVLLSKSSFRKFHIRQNTLCLVHS